MGLQKYRADTEGETDANGAVVWRTEWIGGPSLALIRNCPTTIGDGKRRTVYVRGEPDTFFSIPAACYVGRKAVSGWLGCDDGKWLFHAHTVQP